MLESVTRAPPVGAGPLSATVPVAELPPVTLAGLTESEDKEMDAGAGAGADSKSKTAGLGSLIETATNLVGEII